MSDRFERGLPSLAVDRDSIVIETSDNYQDSFVVRNTGGGILEGQVLARMAGLSVEAVSFTGNNHVVKYNFNASKAGLAIGQTLQGVLYVVSTGGEVEIPVQASLVKMCITTSDGFVISSLLAFYEYAQSHPAQARRIFVDGEFYMFLLAIGYEFVEVYESLHKDSNRERALDNFFILSGIKSKTTIEIKRKNITIMQDPFDKEPIHGQIEIAKSDTGYVDALVSTQTGAEWLTCYASRVISSDFDQTLVAKVAFGIDPKKITGFYARETVQIGQDKEDTVEIVYRRRKPLVATINRSALKYDDKATLLVTNNTGTNMHVEIFCKDSYVRFEARSYVVGKSLEIPFEVKLSPFLSAQLFFRKLPFMQTHIEVKTVTSTGVHRVSIPITVGEL